MTRKRVKLARIVNETTRRLCLKKRRTGLFKKADELSILCDVETAVIVYSPEEDDPEVWPSRNAVERVMLRFLNMPEMETSKKMTTHESYLKERTEKEEEKLTKLRRKNKEKEMEELMNQLMEGKDLNELDIRQLKGLSLMAADQLKQLHRRQQDLSLQDPPPPLPPPPPPAANPPQFVMAASATDLGGHAMPSIPASMEHLANDAWFMDTMTLHQNIDDPSDMGLPPEFVAGMSGATDGEQQRCDDLSRSWPDIFSL